MSIINQVRRQKTLSLSLLLVTLLIGILIGTLVNTGVKADPGQAATDATPLTVPSPIDLSNEFTALAKKLEPAVVFIQANYDPRPQQSAQNRQNEDQPRDEFDLFRRFFGGGPLEELPQRRGSATGSGFIVDPKGYIITNLHVVDGSDEIEVKLVGEQTEHKAKIIGSDEETDLAVIKIDADNPLPAVEIGNSDAVQVGDWAVAIGSPFGLEASVTAGIVSAKGRDVGAQQFQKFIQTDAAINPGNSGGPLLNIRGEVIGVNTQIATRTGGFQGIGFALPMNMAVKVYNMIIKSGKVTRGSIGVRFSNADATELLKALGVDHGVAVTEVEAGGPAEKAGIKPEDILLSIDGEPIKDGDDLVARIADTPVGTEVDITVDRDGKKLDLPVTIRDRVEVFESLFSSNRRQQEAKPSEDSEAKFGFSLRHLTDRDIEALKLEERSGVLVTKVEARSFAEEIGLRPNDVILSINRNPISSIDDVRQIHSSLSSGDPVAFRVLRAFASADGVTTQAVFLVGKLP